MRCFVIMPITTPRQLLPQYGGDSTHFQHVLECLLVPALERAGMEAISPRISGSDVIQASIVRHLAESEYVLCDMSTNNPNVLFELGIRTALNKRAILVRDTLTVVPFDMQIINHHTYAPSLNAWELEEEISRLTTHIASSCVEEQASNSLWQYFGLRTVGAGLGESNEATSMQVLTDEIHALRREIVAVSPPSESPYGYANVDLAGLEIEVSELLRTSGYFFRRPRINIDSATVEVFHPSGAFSDAVIQALQAVVREAGFELNLVAPAASWPQTATDR